MAIRCGCDDRPADGSTVGTESIPAAEPTQGPRKTSPEEGLFGTQRPGETKPGHGLFGRVEPARMPNEAPPGQKIVGTATVSPPRETPPGRTTFGNVSTSRSPREATPERSLFGGAQLTQVPRDTPPGQSIFGNIEPKEAPGGARPRQDRFATTVDPHPSLVQAAPKDPPAKCNCSWKLGELRLLPFMI